MVIRTGALQSMILMRQHNVVSPASGSKNAIRAGMGRDFVTSSRVPFTRGYA